MIEFAVTGIAAGFACYGFVSACGRSRGMIILGFLTGLVVGVVTGVGLLRLLLGVYVLPYAALLGAVVGPLGALKVTKPYSNT